MPTNALVNRRHWTVLWLASSALTLAGTAHAQVSNYVPISITPSPDVYTALNLHPELRPLFGSQVPNQFRTLTVVGDSYADFGNSLRAFRDPATGLVRVNPATGAPLTGVNAQTGRFGNYLNSIDALQYRYGISTANVTNYAVGGAGNGTVNNTNAAQLAVTVLPGISQEVDQLVASGRRFGRDDLVAYTTTGGNDALIGIPAATSTANLINNLQRIIGQGAQTVVLTGSGFQAYNDSQRAALTQYANGSTRVFFFDLVALERQISANPGAYGFIDVTTVCRPTTLSAPCRSTIAGQDQFLMWDGIHLTTSGNALIGAYEANQLNAPATLAAQADLGGLASSTLSSSILNRLDLYRDQGGIAGNPASQVPVSLFIDGLYRSGSQSDRRNAFGYSYDVSGVIVGVEYRVNPNLLLGAAYSHSEPGASLNYGQGTVKTQSDQLAAFGLFNTPTWFAEGVLNAGWQGVRTRRPGVISEIKGQTDGDTVGLGGRGGYLFPLVPQVQLGPVAGLTYANSNLGGYLEGGDPLLTQAVGSTGTSSLVGTLGAEARFTQSFGPVRTVSRLTLSAAHEFLDGRRSIQTAQSSVPELGVVTQLPGRGSRTYGTVAAGVSASVVGGLSAQLTGFTTFGRDGGDSHGVLGGLRYAF